MSLKLHPDDPEYPRHPNTPGGELDLFAPPVAKPRGDAEQLVAPIDGTIQARWERWIASDEGERVFEAFCLEAVARVRSGAQWIGAKQIWEGLRGRFPGMLDNSLTALAARECEQRYPETKGLFRHRVRKAS